MNWLLQWILVSVVVILVALGVGIAMRRQIRREARTADAGSVVVTFPKWQWRTLVVTGCLFIVPGLLMALIWLDEPGPVIAGAAMALAGALIIWAGVRYRRYRIVLGDGTMEVTNESGATRSVLPGDIAFLHESPPSPVGLVWLSGLDANKKRLFRASNTAWQYSKLVVWVATYCPNAKPLTSTTLQALMGM